MCGKSVVTEDEKKQQDEKQQQDEEHQRGDVEVEKLYHSTAEASYLRNRDRATMKR